MGPCVRRDDSYFCIALRSTNVLPPFILWASGASLIWITTASASTPRFFTSACVMSRIMPAFCSSVRPAAMLTVISGISHSLCFLVRFRLPDPARHHLKDERAGQPTSRHGAPALRAILAKLHAILATASLLLRDRTLVPSL